MSPYRKPVPKEKGKTADGKEKRRSAPRWKTVEREKSRWLQDNYGEDNDPVIKHLKTSTGRIGHLVSLGADSTSEHAVGEVKDRNAVPQWLVKAWQSCLHCETGEVQTLEHPLPVWLADAWAQIHQYAATRLSKRRAVLFLSYGKGKRPTYILNGKESPLPDMHVIDEEHHAELIKGWLAFNRIKQLAFEEKPENIQEIYKEIRKVIQDGN